MHVHCALYMLSEVPAFLANRYNQKSQQCWSHDALCNFYTDMIINVNIDILPELFEDKEKL